MEQNEKPCTMCIHRKICPHMGEFRKLLGMSEEYDESAVFEIRVRCRHYLPLPEFHPLSERPERKLLDAVR